MISKKKTLWDSKTSSTDCLRELRKKGAAGTVVGLDALALCRLRRNFGTPDFQTVRERCANTTAGSIRQKDRSSGEERSVRTSELRQGVRAECVERRLCLFLDESNQFHFGVRIGDRSEVCSADGESTNRQDHETRRSGECCAETR